MTFKNNSNIYKFETLPGALFNEQVE